MKLDHLISVEDLTAANVTALLAEAARLKKDRQRAAGALAGKSIVMIFEKPSLRTRVTFETAMFQTGGNAIYLESGNIGPGQRESVPDIARNLSRWVDGIVARTFAHSTITGLAGHATVPVINALTDLEHPCQALACMLTVKEKFRTIKGRQMTYIGDGNNVANSLMLICPLTGMDFTICCPEGYEPDAALMKRARAAARKAGTKVSLVRDKVRAVRNASVIYTDTWASMGQEHEHAKRVKVFKALQVNEALLERAPAGCVVTHCLPAHRGEEITDGVMDGPQSVCFDEAENRLHVQKAVLLAQLKGI